MGRIGIVEGIETVDVEDGGVVARSGNVAGDAGVVAGVVSFYEVDV